MACQIHTRIFVKTEYIQNIRHNNKECDLLYECIEKCHGSKMRFFAYSVNKIGLQTTIPNTPNTHTHVINSITYRK